MSPPPVLVVAALLVLGACSEKPAVLAPTPSGPPTAAAPAAVAESPPGAPVAAPVVTPAAPASLLPLVRAAAAAEPAGTAALAHDGETVVDPGASFEIELGASVPEVRLVLLDAQDAHVAAESAREIGATTRLSLSPAAPLVPGSRYVLRLEGLTTRDVRDDVGRAFSPQSFAVLVAGTPPPPEPQKPTRRRGATRRN